MEVLCTVVIIEHLTRLGKQCLDMFPDPLGPITDDAQAHLRFRNHAGLFDLLEPPAGSPLFLPLTTMDHMDEPLPTKQKKTNALAATPPPPPLSALGALAPVPVTGLPGTVRPCRHIGAINTQYQHGAAGA